MKISKMIFNNRIKLTTKNKLPKNTCNPWNPVEKKKTLP